MIELSHWCRIMILKKKRTVLGQTILVIVLLLFAFGGNILWEFPGSVRAGTDIAGPEVWGTWTNASSPYYINENITVPYNKTLIIEPGVKVICNGSYQILVGGILFANGTKTNRIEFDGNDTGSADYYWSGLKFNATGTGSLQNCTIRNATTGLTLDNSKDIIITNCSIYSNYNGLIIQNQSQNNSIINCKIYNNYRGVLIHNSLKNRFFGGEIAANSNQGLLIQSSSNNIFNNIEVFNNGMYGIDFTGQSTNNLITNSEIYSNNYDESFLYGLIFRVGATDNSVINTYVYNNNVYLWDVANSNIIFQDCNLSLLVIDNTDNVTIKDCDFWNDDYGNLYLNEATDIEINNCEFYTDYINLDLEWSTSIEILNCEITNIYPYGYSVGILLDECNNVLVRSIEIFSIPGSGVICGNSDFFRLENCVISNNTGTGVVIDNYSDHISLIDNTISNNGGYGIELDSVSNISIDNCRIFDNGEYGLNIQQTNDVTINEGIIKNNVNAGIRAENSKRISIYNTEIKNNYGEGVELYKSSIYLENCTLSSNQGKEVRLSSYSTVYMINSTYEYESQIFFTDSMGQFYLGWLLDIRVQTPAGTPAADTTITLVDQTGTMENTTEHVTDAAGMVKQIICYDQLISKYDIFEYNPYNITAYKPTIGVAFKSVDIESSQTLKMILEPIDLIPKDIIFSWPQQLIPVNESFNISLELTNSGANTLYNIEALCEIIGTSFHTAFPKNIPSVSPGTKVYDLIEYPLISKPGEYIVRISIDSDNTVIEINENNNEISRGFSIVTRPVAVLEANRTVVYEGEPITFSAGKSTGQVAILEYIFNFNDGSPEARLKTINSIEHTFNLTGYYHVTLEVIDINGISGEIDIMTITVNEHPDPKPPEDLPVANFTISPSTGNITTSFVFDPSTSSPSSGASIDSYRWTFGDNTTSSWVKPVHNYEDDGVYKVTLKVEDSLGKVSIELDRILVVINLPPKIDLVVSNDIVRVGEPVIFNASNTYDLDDTLAEPQARFIWYFGDPDNTKYSENSILYPDGKFDKVSQFVYSEPGEYIVTLVVYDDDGGRSQITRTIQVLPAINNVINGNATDKNDDGALYNAILALSIILIIIIGIIFIIVRNRKKRDISRKTQETEPDLRSDRAYDHNFDDDPNYSDEELGSTLYGDEDEDTRDHFDPGNEGSGGKEIANKTDKKKSKNQRVDKTGSSLSSTSTMRTSTMKPLVVEVSPSEENVVAWKDESSAQEHIISLADVEVVSDQALLGATRIGVDDEEEEFEYDHIEDIYEKGTDSVDWGVPSDPDYNGERDGDVDGNGISDAEEEDVWVDEEEPFDEYDIEDLEPEQEHLVFEFEEDGETKTKELVVEASPEQFETGPSSVHKKRPKQKGDRLIAIPGVGFVKRSDLRMAVGLPPEDIDGFKADDLKYEEIPIPDGVPLKIDYSLVSEPELCCKWCDKPIKSKYIKFRRKEKDGTKFSIMGPFCSPECASKFSK